MHVFDWQAVTSLKTDAFLGELLIILKYSARQAWANTVYNNLDPDQTVPSSSTVYHSIITL